MIKIKRSNLDYKLNNFCFKLLRRLSLSTIILTNCFILLLTTSINNANALVITTNNTIQGSLPYFSIDSGKNKMQDTDSLLSIKLSNGKVIKRIDDTSSELNPIELPYFETFQGIKTIVPLGNSNYPKIDLAELINYKFFFDDDGDKYADAEGKVEVKWERKVSDNNYTDITEEVKKQPNQQLNYCHRPYRLTITLTKGYLKTNSGLPNQTNFENASHTFYITPKKGIDNKCDSQP